MKLLVFLFLPLLLSFKFNPMSQSIDLGEGQKSAQFLIENDSAESMAIELSVRDRKMNKDGKEDLPKTSELTIFPPQMIIPSKEKRTVRVTWNGSKTLDSERAFRVIAEQLPLSVDNKKKKQSGIQMLMRYMAALYVVPKDAEAELRAKVIASKGHSVTIQVSNTGNKHQVLMEPTVTIKKGDQKWTLKDKELQGLAGENVLAKSEREFILTTKDKIPEDAAVTVKVND